MVNFVSLALVSKILDGAHNFKWSIRGSGRTLRLDLNENTCLHIWNNELAIKGVSIIHDHPWNLESMVICGNMENYVYREGNKGRPYLKQKMRVGYDGGLSGQRENCFLNVVKKQVVIAGEIYTQSHKEIHEGFPLTGTITIVNREFVKDYIPTVYWKATDNIIDNRPKIAKVTEMYDYIDEARKLLKYHMSKAAEINILNNENKTYLQSN